MTGGRVEYDAVWEVYRVRTDSGVLLGSEYGGYPCAFEDRLSAVLMVRRRERLAQLGRWLRKERLRDAS